VQLTWPLKRQATLMARGGWRTARRSHSRRPNAYFDSHGVPSWLAANSSTRRTAQYGPARRVAASPGPMSRRCSRSPAKVVFLRRPLTRESGRPPTYVDSRNHRRRSICNWTCIFRTNGKWPRSLRLLAAAWCC